MAGGIREATNGISDEVDSEETEEGICSDWEITSEKDLEGLEMPPLNPITDPFKQKWKEQKIAYQANSKYRFYQTYAIKPMIVKANDDCRQEVLAV